MTLKQFSSTFKNFIDWIRISIQLFKTQTMQSTLIFLASLCLNKLYIQSYLHQLYSSQLINLLLNNKTEKGKHLEIYMISITTYQSENDKARFKMEY